jgi:hypothetical protein
MQYLALATLSDQIKYEEMPSLIHEEVRYAWGLYKSGIVRTIHHRQDVRGVVVMLEADSLESVENALGSLPLAKAGYLNITNIIPLAPYTSYERIFRTED